MSQLDQPWEAQEITITSAGKRLKADLSLPGGATGLVIFAHGSGSGRSSPRNRAVAQTLQQAGLGTLLMDLLDQHEQRIDEQTAHLRFDIPLLAVRLIDAVDWAAADSRTEKLRLGLYGASTGAAAALLACAQKAQAVRAIVSRGGRPDLAGEGLAQVTVPVLLIVGALDVQVLEMNRHAARMIAGPCEVAIVPGASHLFEEPGTLEQAALLTRDWFLKHLTG